MQDSAFVMRGAPILHWSVVNIPGDVTKLPVGMKPEEKPAAAIYGPNFQGAGKPYLGPRTPPGPKLSIRLNYPNRFDHRMAQSDGRTQLGGDIMIHGGAASIGCLALGNDAAEDLFVLTALVGTEQVRIIVSPTDFREASTQAPRSELPWIKDLYASLRAELQQYRRSADRKPTPHHGTHRQGECDARCNS